jgi:Tol biopolymer transport system component
MASDRWRLISRIYAGALKQPAAQRDAFLREGCDGDMQLERDVRSLLAQPSSDSLMNDVLQEGAAAALEACAPRPPAKLGRFEVRGLLGAGGMGEVYRAYDGSLGREVAIKILPTTFTGDAERLARFEREARILAALSHPHIAALYGVEELGAGSDGDAAPRALVLEFVDGETLAERLGRSRLSTGEAIDIARQIAAGMAAAHDTGVVHRDLKPANIKIRPDGVVKILDFGLAKADALLAGSGAEPLLKSAETVGGVVLGTPAYMSPEQARGGVVDKRADVWAFGCVLFEMLTGKAPFAGGTAADSIAAVLEREPDWSLVPSRAPAAVHQLLRRCLEKQPQRRLRDVGDARFELQEESRLATPPPQGRTARVLAGAALGGAIAFAALLQLPRLREDGAVPRVQLTLQPPDGHTIVGVPVPSPDGRHLLFAARAASGESALWVRDIDATAARRIAGTEQASNPFWSPDGRSVAFGVAKTLKRTAIAGGPVQRIADLDPVALGASWNRDDVIVFAPSNQAPLHRVSASGGAPERLTTLNGERLENSHRWPQFLPDGRHFIFTARSELPDNTGIYVASLDNPGSPTRLLNAQSAAVFVSPGFLLFLRDNTLLAQPFDVRRLALSGNAVAIAGDVAAFAASADGTVLTHIPVAMTRLTWIDRSGAERSVIQARGRFSQVRLSPDESRAAVVTSDQATGGRDIWVVALADGGVTRITSHPAADWFPVWSPDGSEIVFASERRDTNTFYAVPSSGGGREREVFQTHGSGLVAPTDWSRDGRFVLFHSYPRADISVLALTTPDTPAPVVSSPFADWIASFSPDGRWIAYESDESGQDEVYVRAIAHPTQHRVSVGGGTQPRWRRDGRELFYIGAGDRLFAAAVTTAPRLTVDQPKPLFQACPQVPGQEGSPFMYRYDVGADGARSLWTCPEEGRRLPTVAVHAIPR